MGLDFCLVVPLSSLAPQAELLLSCLLLYAAAEASLHLPGAGFEGKVWWSLCERPLSGGHAGSAQVPLQEQLKSGTGITEGRN